jgi:sporulation protein YunB
MQKWRRIWPRIRARGRTGGWGGDFLISAVLGIGLAVLAIYLFDGRVRPVVVELAETSARNAVTRVVNEAVERILAAEAVSYDDMITLQKDASGQITALTSNSVEMNRLRAEILNDIVAQVDILDSKELGIPLGHVLGLATLSDSGPRLPVRVLSVASAGGNLRNEFTSAGINQTYHRIMLDVTVDVKLLIPGGKVETTVYTQVNLAETVIVGKVPDAYLQFGEQTK